MVTAAELLAGAINVDRTLVVDNAFRTINIPSSVRNLGVENDDEVLYLDFKLPRYVSNTDLSVFKIRINYINAQGETDAYTVLNPVVDSQYISFTWLVGPTATRYRGETSFNICAITLKDDGETIDREFNTTPATLPVLEGLEVDESVVDNYSDLIEQWRRELFGFNEVVRDDISTKADAIVCNAGGETITVSDSSDDYIRGLRVFGKSSQVSTTGKQLININQPIKTGSGITFIPNPDGSVHVIGTATDNSYFIIDQKNPIKFKETDLIATLHGGEGVYMVIGYNRADGTIQNDIQTVTNDGPFTLAYPADAATTRTFLGVNKGTTVNTTVYPMIRLATIEDDTPEPYSGGLPAPAPSNPSEIVSVGPEINVNVNGQNILPYPYTHTTRTVHGCTFTDIGDGGIGLSGTPTSYADMTLTTTLMLDTDMTIALLGTYENVTLSIALQCGGNQSMAHVTSNPSKPVVLLKDDYPENTIIELRLKRTGDNKPISGIAYPIVVRGTVAPREYVPFTNIQGMLLNCSLPGLPVTSGGNYTDSDGQQWICDEIDFERGVYVKRVGELTLTGTETWQAYSKGNVITAFRMKVNDMWSDVNSYSASRYSLWSNHFKYGGYISENQTTGIGLSEAQYIYLRFDSEDDVISTIDELNVWLAAKHSSGNSVTIKYPLATPIETPLTAEEIAAFKALHTNYPNTTVLNDAGATMELAYNVDTKTYVDNNSGSVSDEDIANAVENYLEENPIDTPDVDLSDYVKKTDYGSLTEAGLCKGGVIYGTYIGAGGIIVIQGATEAEVLAKSSPNKPIVPTTLDYAVKTGLTTNTIALTEEEQAAAQNWLGLGSIETALDSIIEIQNNLIGGDGA